MTILDMVEGGLALVRGLLVLALAGCVFQTINGHEQEEVKR